MKELQTQIISNNQEMVIFSMDGKRGILISREEGEQIHKAIGMWLGLNND